jgi:hypothetical protein
MAGMGPPPKPARKRRRRTKPASYGAAEPTTAPAAHVLERELSIDDPHPLVVPPRHRRDDHRPGRRDIHSDRDPRYPGGVADNYEHPVRIIGRGVLLPASACACTRRASTPQRRHPRPGPAAAARSRPDAWRPD